MGSDGSVATNGFWSALVIATTLQLPLLFFIEDNQFGISVPASLQTPGGDIAANLACFKGLHVLTGSGSQPEETWQVIQEGVLHVRSE
jgi:2-oxoisovalerate dehydrogenase E1 component